MAKLEVYREFAPTPFDARGAFLDEDRQGWLIVPVSRTRDSGILSNSNFETAEKMLDDIDSERESFETHSFGHWGPGWFEIMIVAPNSRAASIAAEIGDALENYPVLNDEDYSRREYEGTIASWDASMLCDRIDACRDNGVSIFAARHDSIVPEQCYQAFHPDAC